MHSEPRLRGGLTLSDILAWLQAYSIQATLTFDIEDAQLNRRVAITINLFRRRETIIYDSMLAEIAIVWLCSYTQTKLDFSHWRWLFAESVGWFFELGHRDGAMVIQNVFIQSCRSVTVHALAVNSSNVPILRAENLSGAHNERWGRLPTEIADIWYRCVMWTLLVRAWHTLHLVVTEQLVLALTVLHFTKKVAEAARFRIDWCCDELGGLADRLHKLVWLIHYFDLYFLFILVSINIVKLIFK